MSVHGTNPIHNHLRAWHVGFAGAAGAITRIFVGQMIPSDSGFPTGTLLINLVGTFLLCIIITGAFRKLTANKELQTAVTTGFLGSFTTFSAFSLETMQLLVNGQTIFATLYVVGSMIGGLAAGIFGFYLGGKKVGG